MRIIFFLRLLFKYKKSLSINRINPIHLEFIGNKCAFFKVLNKNKLVFKNNPLVKTNNKFRLSVTFLICSLHSDERGTFEETRSCVHWHASLTPK